MLVDYINISEKRYPVSYNMYSLTWWAKECGIPLDDLFGGELNVDFDAYEGLVLMYAGLKFGAKEVSRRFNMTESEFGIHLAKEPTVGEGLVEIFNRHMEKMSEEIGVKDDGQPDAPDDDSQKKASK